MIPRRGSNICRADIMTRRIIGLLMLTAMPQPDRDLLERMHFPIAGMPLPHELMVMDLHGRTY